jgi:hypothetical protein
MVCATRFELQILPAYRGALVRSLDLARNSVLRNMVRTKGMPAHCDVISRYAQPGRMQFLRNEHT